MAKVFIIGGGVAGMSAAHELVERGYEVEVFERNPKYVGTRKMRRGATILMIVKAFLAQAINSLL